MATTTLKEGGSLTGFYFLNKNGILQTAPDSLRNEKLMANTPAFPDHLNKKSWIYVEPKKKEDRIYWLTFKRGSASIQKNLGFKDAYRKITLGKPSEMIIEYNFFRRGVIARIWGVHGENTSTAYVQILKNGKWISGMRNAKLIINELLNDKGQFCGVKLTLKIAADRSEVVRIYKNKKPE